MSDEIEKPEEPKKPDEIEIPSEVSATFEPTALSAEAPLQSELDINVKEKPKEKKTVFNHRDKSYLHKMMDAPKEKPGGGNSDQEDAKKRLLGDVSSDNRSGPVEDQTANAELLVEGLDWIIVTIITIFSLGKDNKEYKTDPANKKVIVKHFSKWLAVKMVKAPTGWLLFLAFLSTYAFVAKKAYDDRKENKAKKEAEKRFRQENMNNMQGEERKRRKMKDEPRVEDAQVIHM